MTNEIQCYSQRMLNPYRGIFCCISYQSAEAVTADGINWDIYVSNDALREGLADDVIVQTSDIRFGKWSLAQGLRRGPMYPSDDFHRLEDMGYVVLEHLMKVHDQVPFSFSDHIELWLLDQSGKPLALLDSVINPADIVDTTLTQWQCGIHCMDEFSSQALDKHAGLDSVPAGQWLMREIQELSGAQGNAVWVERQADGSGSLLDGDTVIDAGSFPLYPIRYSEFSGLMAKVMQEYIHWQAPWLLQLNLLNSDQRRELEVAAGQQALVMDKLHRLYPCVVDIDVINAARVEAAMRRAANKEPEEQPPDNRHATYYIEPDKRPFQ